ncbi:hypothetical protein BV898_00405 [Hypsibius exemplaris]|uniref:Uncharacterized protein n=1 Tax=Hypsibius exemplaris TaxID=2072580 RepID=A0A1W0XDA4_HYPEX|nr:hypothetical protein BV898_00405 [Hypsibius exemplaris]
MMAAHHWLTFIVATSLALQATAFFAFSPNLDHFPSSVRARIRSSLKNRSEPRVVGTLTDGELADALFLTGDPLGDCPNYASCNRRLDYHVRRLRKLMGSPAMKARVDDVLGLLQ